MLLSEPTILQIPYYPVLFLWENLLGDYTGRELTDPRDRLNGLSGVTEIFDYLKDEYVARFWRSDIYASLLWTTTLEPFNTDLAPRPAVYCGPS